MEKHSFWEHILDLRKKVIEYLIVLFILVVLSLIFVKEILSVLLKLISIELVFISPLEGFLAIWQVGFLTGFILSLPFLLLQIWRFISSALTKKENKKLMIYLPLSFLLFAAGVALAYFVIAPLGLKFLISYGSRFFKPMISVKDYISFITTFFLIFGIIFQLPLIILFLNSVGLISREQLKDKRKHFYVLAFIIAAILTPTPDAITQICAAVPIIILYEISYLLVIIRVKPKKLTIENNS